MRLTTTLAAALTTGAVALTGLASPAAAQTAGDKADVRCILVLGVAAKDPKNQAKALQGQFYFLGRVDAHGMGPKLEGIMLTEGKTMNTAQVLQAELTRCGTQLTQSVGVLGKAYQDLEAQARASAPAGAAAPAGPAPAPKPPAK